MKFIFLTYLYFTVFLYNEKLIFNKDFLRGNSERFIGSIFNYFLKYKKSKIQTLKWPKKSCRKWWKVVKNVLMCYKKRNKILKILI